MKPSRPQFLFAGLLTVAMLFALVSVALAEPIIGVGVGIPNAQHSAYPGYCLDCHPGFEVWPAPTITEGATATHAFRGSTCTQCHTVLAPPPPPATPTPAPNAVTLNVPVTGAYAAAVMVSGTLRTPEGNPCAEEPVFIEYSYDNTTWTTLALAPSSADGNFSAIAYPKRKMYFRAVHPASQRYAASVSPVMATLPRVSLTVPSTPVAVRKGVAFTAKGYLKPAHAVGTFPVTLKCYRYEKQRNGTRKWVLRKSVPAKASAYGTYTKYSKRIALPSVGKWAIRAYHAADSRNAATTTKPRLLTVR